jgi:hypothetical protein
MKTKKTTIVKTKVKPKLGPLQKELVKALESGKFRQGNGYLAKYSDKSKKIKYCCLGVACKIIDVPMQENVYDSGIKEFLNKD